MNLTVTQLIENTELNDFKIRNIELDIDSKRFKMELEGAYWFKDKKSKPIELNSGGTIIVDDYNSFEAKYFSPKDRLWETLDYKNLEFINEVNEKSYTDKVLKLAGIGKCSGYWIEYLIKGGDCKIFFND